MSKLNLHYKDFKIGDELPEWFLKEIPECRLLRGLNDSRVSNITGKLTCANNRKVKEIRHVDYVKYYLISGTTDSWFTNNIKSKTDLDCKIEEELGL